MFFKQLSKFSMEFRKQGGALLCIAGGVFAGELVADYLIVQRDYSQSYAIFKSFADTNRDGLISEDEWTNVFEVLQKDKDERPLQRYHLDHYSRICENR
jgi:hypothetical protein